MFTMLSLTVLLFWTNRKAIGEFFFPEADVGGPHLGGQTEVMAFVLDQAGRSADAEFVRSLGPGQSYWGLSDALVARWKASGVDLAGGAEALQMLLQYAAMAPLSFAIIELNIEHLLKLTPSANGAIRFKASGLYRSHPVLQFRQGILLQ
ncbi:hypothetical protein [Roseateles sp. MS654]|uniref:hypothetical protein n=1 Tax=Roseateles sp. MS654 TaxID=3412685 RepID=UPI003C309B84